MPITEPHSSSSMSGGRIPEAASARKNAFLPSVSLRSYASSTSAVVSDRAETQLYTGFADTCS